MLGKGRVKVVGAEGQVELVLPQVVGLGMLLQLRQLQLVVALGVGEVDDGESVALDAAILLQAQGLLVKG